MKSKNVLRVTLFFIFPLGLILGSAIILLGLLFTTTWYEKHQIAQEGSVLIAQIESFKKENGRLPETLMEIGKKREELEGPIAYWKASETGYGLQALITMDSSYYYDSETREWTEKP
jgi:hypothetical protein